MRGFNSLPAAAALAAVSQHANPPRLGRNDLIDEALMLARMVEPVACAAMGTTLAA
jgi:hypothetical protein